MVEQLAIVNLEGSKTHVEAKAVIEGVAMLTGTSGERVERDPKAGTASTRDHLPRERIVNRGCYARHILPAEARQA